MNDEPPPERPSRLTPEELAVVDGRSWLRVTDLKQHLYCPRLAYYTRCLPDLAPRTYLMDAGKDAHETERTRAARRSLVPYDVVAGQRQFDVWVESARLGVRGRLDEVIWTADGLALPVDYKLSGSVSGTARLQVAAYCVLLEDQTGRPSPAGFVVLLGKRGVTRVPLTEALRADVAQLVEQVRQMEWEERMPEPTTERSKCAVCEYRRFCNDV